MKTTMKQEVMTEPGKIIFQDVPVPETQADQVLVKIKRIGVCGSDIDANREKTMKVLIDVDPSDD